MNPIIFTTIAAFSNGNFLIAKSCDSRQVCDYEIKPNRRYQCEFLDFRKCLSVYEEPERCGSFKVLSGDFENISCCDSEFGPSIVESKESCPVF